MEKDEIIPTDGILLEAAELDFSLITGESHGIHMQKGQFVGAGAKLISQNAKLKIPQGGTSSLLTKIVEGTISAFNTKKEIVSIGDKISQKFVPAVLFIAVTALIYFTPTKGYNYAILSFMSVLIVACPCAFE